MKILGCRDVSGAPVAGIHAFTGDGMLPNFVYFGVPKSGSATITELLKAHPQVFCPRPKELNFFNRDSEYGKGVSYYRERYFSDASGEKVLCDNSIGYSSGDFTATAARIRAQLGAGIRVLMTLRHPAERAYSQYCMARYKGGVEKLEFPDALKTAVAVENAYDDLDLRRMESGAYYSSARDMAVFRHAMYLVPGRYADIIRVLRSVFGPENLLVLFTEDIAEDLPGEFRKLTDFIGVDPVEVPRGLRANEATALKYPWLKQAYNSLYAVPMVRRSIRAMNPRQLKFLRRHLMSWNYTKNNATPAAPAESMAFLQAYYRDQMTDLAGLLARDMSPWLDKYPAGVVRR